MTILDAQGREMRAAVKASDPYLATFLGDRGGMQSYVDAGRASGLAIAHACISLISQNLAAVPLNVYRAADDGGRIVAPEHPVYDVLQNASCEGMTAFEVREILTADLLVTGNAFAKLTWNGRGQVVGMTPMPPRAVSVERLSDGRLRYRLTHRTGRTETVLADEMLHVRYRLDAERSMGLSPLAIARETFNTALEQSKQANKQARHSMRSEGVFSFDHALGNEAVERASKQAAQILDPAGADTSKPGIMILSGGGKYQPMNFSPRDSEFLESRKLTNLDLCRVFNVPPSSVGIPDTNSYANGVEEARALVIRCLSPMAKRIENAMNAALLTATSRRTFTIEHDLSGLMRGDLKARYEAFGMARTSGFLSVNEIRAMEGLGKIEGGDRYLEPLNMTGADDAANVE